MIQNILHRLHPRTLLEQIVGNAVLALLFAAWLQIPDSHAWQLLFSMFMIAALGAAFLILHVRTIQRMHDPAQPVRQWLACILLAAWGLIAHIAAHCLNTLHDSSAIFERAGYWNSKLSASLRPTFSYTRLSDWQQDIFSILLWWILPALLLPLAVESVSNGLRSLLSRTIRCIYTYWPWWLFVGLFAWLGVWISGKLVNWQPGHTVHGELISLTVRFALIYLIDILLYCFVLAFTSAALARCDVRQNSSGNTTP